MRIRSRSLRSLHSLRSLTASVHSGDGFISQSKSVAPSSHPALVAQVSLSDRYLHDLRVMTAVNKGKIQAQSGSNLASVVEDLQLHRVKAWCTQIKEKTDRNGMFVRYECISLRFIFEGLSPEEFLSSEDSRNGNGVSISRRQLACRFFDRIWLPFYGDDRVLNCASVTSEDFPHPTFTITKTFVELLPQRASPPRSTSDNVNFSVRTALDVKSFIADSIVENGPLSLSPSFLAEVQHAAVISLPKWASSEKRVGLILPGGAAEKDLCGANINKSSTRAISKCRGIDYFSSRDTDICLKMAPAVFGLEKDANCHLEDGKVDFGNAIILVTTSPATVAGDCGNPCHHARVLQTTNFAHLCFRIC